MVSFDAQPYSKKLLHLISWSHWFTFFNIIAAILLSIFYLYSDIQPQSPVGYIYMVTTWLSHMGFLVFMSFVLLLFPIILIYPRTNFIRGIASVVFTVGLFLLLLDAFVYSRLGYHLNASSSDQIISMISSLISHNSAKFWLICLISASVILTFELVVSNYAWKHLRSLQNTVFAKFVVIGLVVSFFISHFIHIWADANLKYDVLKQDTILPLSYPSTAKTLLTKYGMFDIDDYMERRTSALTFNTTLPNYPLLADQCAVDQPIENSAILILTKKPIPAEKINQIIARSNSHSVQMTRHVDSALEEDAWFNLFYSLPSIYQQALLTKKVEPLIFQAVKRNNLDSSFTVIGDESKERKHHNWIRLLMNHHLVSKNISNLIFTNDKAKSVSVINRVKPGLHTVFFDEEDGFQFSLFVEAILLAQKTKSVKDIIWIGSIGSESDNKRLSNKPALLLLPNSKTKTIKRLTSVMDVQPTILTQWLRCDVDSKLIPNGSNVLTVKNHRVLANTLDNGIVVFNKDKSIYVDQHGNFQSYSTQLHAPITVSSDFPLMIDGVHFIKKYTKQDEAE